MPRTTGGATYYYNYPRPIADEDARSMATRPSCRSFAWSVTEGGAFDYVVGAFTKTRSLLGSTQYSFLIRRLQELRCAAAGCFLTVADDNDYDFRRHERSTEIAGYSAS